MRANGKCTGEAVTDIKREKRRSLSCFAPVPVSVCALCLSLSGVTAQAQGSSVGAAAPATNAAGPYAAPRTPAGGPAIGPEPPAELSTPMGLPRVGTEAPTETIPLKLPPSDKLLPLGAKLPPIRLEATYTQPVSLRDVLLVALENNLPIGIARNQLTAQRWQFVSQLGRFFPNALMNFESRYLEGSTLIGGVIPTTFATPSVSTSATFQMFGFRGGSVVFGSLASLHNWRASKAQLQGTINDVLLQVAQGYYNLMRNQALLEIQTMAVEVSRAQVELNKKLERAGTGTRFNVLQSETQLATDEQNLLVQEVQLRNAAIQLAANLNINLGVNMLSVEREVRKMRLIDPALTINDLLGIAIANRPELKQYRNLYLAAKRQIQVNAAPLYPVFQFFAGVTGSGATLSPGDTVQPGSFSVVPIGTPLQGVTATNNAGLSSSVYQAGVVFNPPQSVRRQVRKSYNIGFRVDWNYENMGAPSVANIQAQRAVARQVSLQANQQLITVISQVRQSYLNSQTAERLIDVASKQVVSAAEQLRLARVRLANGVGTNLDVITAQRDWTQALVRKADAIIQFNNAQVQLLRDLGVISLDTLTSGRLVRK